MKLNFRLLTTIGIISIAIGVLLYLNIAQQDLPGSAAAVVPKRTLRTKIPELRGYLAIVLVSQTPIQQELGLDETQRREIATIGNEFLRTTQPFVAKAQELARHPEGVNSTPWKGMQQARQTVFDDYNAAAWAVLSANQQARLQQIALQLRQEELFYQADVRKHLQLNQVQQSKINKRRLEVIASARGYRGKFTKKEISKPDYDAAIASLRIEAAQTYQSYLSTEQLALLEAIHGPSVAFEKSSLKWELRVK